MNFFNSLQKYRGIVMLIGFCAIMACLVSGASMMILLLVLGILDFLYGLLSLKAPGAQNQAVMMMMTGIYILIMGTIFWLNIFEEQMFWTIGAGGLVVVAIIGLIIIKRRKN